MMVSMTKIFTQHVHKRGRIDVTDAEVAEAEVKFKFKCDFCTRRFRTDRDKHIHRTSCAYNYNTTEEVFVVEDIVGVFGDVDARWFLVKWEGYEDPEWEREHLLTRDGCHGIIRDFWTQSGLSPCEKFYARRPERRPQMCSLCEEVPESTGPKNT